MVIIEEQVFVQNILKGLQGAQWKSSVRIDGISFPIIVLIS